MKRFLFLLLLNCLSTSLNSEAQITISGTVYVQSGTLENAVVYFNNTMIGTTTDTNGEFSIQAKEGQHELIVSYLGYKTINYSLNTANYTKSLVFVLNENNEMLDEIIIRKTIYNDDWKYNLQRFKNEFIGKTKLSKDCILQNPEVIHFEYNAKENILTAYPRAPLKIKHKGLGYLITYEVLSFEINKNYVSYLGYSRYENLRGGKRKQKRWKKNRLTTYNGSSVHFYKSALKNTIYEEGFIVHQFKRVQNPDRPSEKEIKAARQLIRLARTSINFSSKIDAPKNAVDSALVTIRKSRLPRFKDYLYKSKIQQSEIISIKDKIPYLDFKDNVIVVYTKEKEEQGYILRKAFSKPRKAVAQSSSIIPLERPNIIDKTGILLNPLHVLYEGYWSYEKLANSLPLDYIPQNK
jgi:hypothetical protein